MALPLPAKDTVLVGDHLDPFFLVTLVQMDRLGIRPDGRRDAVGPTQACDKPQYEDQHPDELRPNTLDGHAPLFQRGICPFGLSRRRDALIGS